MGHYREVSLTNPIVITTYEQFQTKGHWEPMGALLSCEVPSSSPVVKTEESKCLNVIAGKRHLRKACKALPSSRLVFLFLGDGDGGRETGVPEFEFSL